MVAGLAVLDAAFEAAPDIAAVIDADGHVVAVNEAWLAFAGESFTSACGVGADYLAACRRASQNGDSSADKALTGLLAVLTGHIAHSVLDYPCPTPQGLRWYRAEAVPLGEGRGALVRHLDITAWIRRERELEIEAATDPLTGLPNRRGVIDYLNVELDRGQAVVVMMGDIENFKTVNDSRGYLAGDRCLIETARQLNRALGREGRVGRWGGDEFVVVIAGDEPERVSTRADEIVSWTRHPSAGMMRLSWGMAWASPEDTAAQLIGRAAHALQDFRPTSGARV